MSSVSSISTSGSTSSFNTPPDTPSDRLTPYSPVSILVQRDIDDLDESIRATWRAVKCSVKWSEKIQFAKNIFCRK